MTAQKNRLANSRNGGASVPKPAMEPAVWLESALAFSQPASSQPALPSRRLPAARNVENPGNFFRVRVEYTLPFFLAALIALNLCALLSLWGFPAPRISPAPPSPPLAEAPEAVLPEPFADLSPTFLQEPEPIQDLVSKYYEDPLLQDLVIDFFSRITGSRDIAELILAAAKTHKVPPSLAFAVAWEESRYRPRAINTHNRNDSIDRGLFQLNSRSFPKLSETEFFDPRINTWYGIAHLRWCLDAGGSTIVALAMYNAGLTRINSTGTPKTTLQYVERVLGACQKIDSCFKAEITRLNIETPDPPITLLTELASANP